MEELFKKIYFVERDNLDLRKFKVMHPLDGRGFPLDISFLKKCSKKLLKKMGKIDFDYVVGFAEGGIPAALGFSIVSNKPFVGSYRVKLKEKGEIKFQEPHSSRSQHYIYGLKEGDRVVIIEDEITTGRTIINAINSFKENGLNVQAVGSFVLNGLGSNEKEVLNKMEVPLFHLVDLENESKRE